MKTIQSKNQPGYSVSVYESERNVSYQKGYFLHKTGNVFRSYSKSGLGKMGANEDTLAELAFVANAEIDKKSEPRAFPRWV